MPSQRRSRFGDFLAVLLLLAIIAGVGWLWWHEKHPPKHHRARAVTSAPAEVAPETIAPPKPKPLVLAPQTAADFPRPVRDVFEAQVALMRRAISPGSLDAAIGSQTRAAIMAFQRSEKLSESGLLDTNTRAILTLDAPLLTTYTVTTNDLLRLQPLGKTWLEKSQQSALDYETLLELVAEKAHSHPLLIEKLNQDVDWTNVVAGTALKVPGVEYPEPSDKAAFVVIHLSAKILEAFDADTNLLLHCPCSIAAKVEKRPVGELHVAVVIPHPNYTFDPAVFPESPEAQAIGHKLVLQPGPNNPVGLAWIGLDKPGYGMHGTPVPEQVGRTESHGCFRLANWDATYMVKLAWVGMPVEVVP
jgi:lipoprotein-anchoring transpeptidase ErfK/SrfK